MIKGAMAVAQIDGQDRRHVLPAPTPEVDRDHRQICSNTPLCYLDAERRQYEGENPLTTAAPRPPFGDAQAVV